MLTPEEQKELSYLGSLSYDEPAPVHGMARVGQNLANVPSRALGTFLNGLAGFPQLFTPQEYKTPPIQIPQPYTLPPAQSFGDKAIDFGGAVIPELAALMVPAMGAARLGRTVGMTERAALSAGDLAAGSIQAGSHNDPLAIPEFAAFGMLRPLGVAGRIVGGTGLSMGSQVAHGRNPFTPEGVVRTTVDALFSGIDKLPERTPFARGEAPIAAIETPVAPTSPPTPGLEVFSPESYLRRSPVDSPWMMQRAAEMEDARLTEITRNPFKRESFPEPVILGGQPIPEAQRMITPLDPVPPAGELITPGFGRGPREQIDPAKIELFKKDLAEIKTLISKEKSLPRKIELQQKFDEVQSLVDLASQHSLDTVQQGGRLGFNRTAEDFIQEPGVKESLTPEAPMFSREAFKERMASNRAEAAFTTGPDIIADFGRSIYQAGMDFATWSGEMIRKFGDAVKDTLEPIFRAISNPTRAVTRNPITRTPFARTQNKAIAGKISLDVPFLSRSTKQAIKSRLDLRELPAPIKGKMTQAEGFKAVAGDKLQVSAKELKKIAPTMTPAESSVLRDLSRGKIDEAAAIAKGATPEGVGIIKGLREQTEAVQRPIVQAESSWARKKMIARSYGDHASRDYDIFTAPDEYKIDPDKLSKVVDEVVGLPEFSGNRNMAEHSVRQQLDEYMGDAKQIGSGDPRIQQHIYKKRHLTEEEKTERLRAISDDIATGKAAGHDIKELEQELKDVADSPVLTQAWRDLLGERTNPIEAKIRTVAKLVNSAANAQLITALRDVEVAPGIKGTMTPEEFNAATKGLSPEEMSKFPKYRKTSDSPALGVLGEKYVHPEVERAINSAQEMTGEFMPKWIRKINSEIKTNFTVRNPATSIRNALTSPAFLLMAKNGVDTWHPALKEWRDKSPIWHEARRMGAIGGDFVSGELLKRVENMVNFKSENAIIGGLKKTDKFLKDVYKAPDQFVRFVTYRNARNRGLTPDEAIQFVDRYTPNYGAVPEGIKTLRDIPLVNPFLSYNYEIFRILKNLTQDVGNSKLPVKERVRSAQILATVVTLPFIAKEGAEAAMSDEEMKEWDRIHAMSRDYQRSQFRVPLKKREDGTWVYVNIDPFNVAGDLNKFILSAWNGDFKAMKADNPLVGLNNTPILNVLSELVAGESITGKKIEGATGVAGTIVRNTAPPLLGGYAGSQMTRSFTPNAEGGLGVTNERTGRKDTPSYFAPTLLGVRPAQVNSQTLKRGLIFERNEKIADAKRELKDVLRSNRTESAKQKAREIFQRKREAIQRDFLRRTQ